jgi:hypothetical protein
VDCGGQQVDGDALEGADFDPTCGTGGDISNIKLDVCHVLENVLRLWQQHPAQGSERNRLRATGALEEPGSDVLFQRSHLLTDSGLAVPEFVRGGTEGLFTGNGDESGELPKRRFCHTHVLNYTINLTIFHNFSRCTNSSSF